MVSKTASEPNLQPISLLEDIVDHQVVMQICNHSPVLKVPAVEKPSLLEPERRLPSTHARRQELPLTSL